MYTPLFYLPHHHILHTAIMGFFSTLYEVAEAAVPWTSVEAEAPTRGGATTENSAATDAVGEKEGEVAVCAFHYICDASGGSLEGMAGWRKMDNGAEDWRLPGRTRHQHHTRRQPPPAPTRLEHIEGQHTV